MGRLSLPGADDALEVIVKLAGDSCNINCHYCYERRKPYDRNRVLTPEILSDFLASLAPRPLNLALHGGEPLIIGMPRLRGLLDVVRSYPGPIALSMQTNGTLLSDRVLEELADLWPGLELGISADGPKELSGHRVDHRDRPVHAAVEAALKRCEHKNLKIGVVVVITRAHLENARALLDYFAEFDCVGSVNLAPCFDFNVASKIYRNASGRSIQAMNSGEGVPAWAIEPLEYARFLEEAFLTWRNAGYFRRFTVEPFFSAMRNIVGASAALCHFSTTKCAHVLTLYPDGAVGTCDEIPTPASRLSKSLSPEQVEPILSLDVVPALRRDLEDLLSKCSTCRYQPTCGGGCLSTRRAYQHTPYDDEYCEYRGRFIDFLEAQMGHDDALTGG